MVPEGSVKNVTVIGGGVSGIVSAYILSRKYRVSIFEKNDYLGGHTNTRIISEGEDAGIPVDTGFIVFNYKTYPLFTKFLEQLSVEVIDAPMSFSYYNKSKRFQYSSVIPKGIFADKKNIFRLFFWKMLREITVFNKQAQKDLHDGTLAEVTIGEYLYRHKFSHAFRDYYLLPMAAAIWSSPKEAITDFPCESFLRFYENHGLLSVFDQPQWKTVKGGSQCYVRAFQDSFKGEVYLNEQIRSVKRTEGSVVLTTGAGKQHEYDAVVIAAHADQAFAMLEDPSDAEKQLLGPWEYSENDTVLHSDSSLMPPSRNAWASWNYYDVSEQSGSKAVLTYYMNILQDLKAASDYLVSLNSTECIDKNNIIYQTMYEHPVYNKEALRTQHQLPLMLPERRTFFCGSYCGYGFHEDAVRSAVMVAEEAFGLRL